MEKERQKDSKKASKTMQKPMAKFEEEEMEGSE